MGVGLNAGDGGSAAKGWLRPVRPAEITMFRQPTEGLARKPANRACAELRETGTDAGGSRNADPRFPWRQQCPRSHFTPHHATALRGRDRALSGVAGPIASEEAMSVTITEHCWIPLPDGTRLAARLWLPDAAAAAPVPAVLEYIPYRKRDGTRGRDEPMHGFFAGQGYAAVRVDMRGSGESDGLLADEYLLQEQDDAIAVIAWIADQPWCSGQVGMMGKSWGGFNALQVAARQPPALKAIITVCSTDDRFADDIHYMGGALLNDNLWWGTIMLAFQARPPDPALVGESWRTAWIERLQQMPFWPALWLRHQARDEYWRHGSVCEAFSAIRCPVFVVGGWADSYTNAVPRLLEGLSVPRLGLIGTWAHLYPHDGTPGPAVDFLGEATRWWDYWLKGRDTGVMDQPVLRAFIEDWQPPSTTRTVSPGRFVGERSWPSPAIVAKPYHLGAGRLSGTAEPAAAPLSIRSPLWTGTAGGEWMGTGVAGDRPADQRLDDGFSLIFDSEPLGEAVEVLGNPVLALVLSSDYPQAQIAVRLCDVAPDGASLRVSYGVLNLAHRDGSAAPEPLVPGAPVPVRVTLKMCGHRFAPGHRIRLAISTAYWPLLWPARDPATLTIAPAESRLDLPVRAGGDRIDLPGPRHGPFAPSTRTDAGSVARSIAINLMSGTATYSTVGQGGLFGEGVIRWDDTGTSLSHDLERRLTVTADDPLSAEARIVQTYRVDGRGFSARIESVTAMTGDHEIFTLTGTLKVFDGDGLVHVRDWKERIPRLNL